MPVGAVVVIAVVVVVVITCTCRCSCSWSCKCSCYEKRRFNVQKWSEHVVSLPFSLWNVFRATPAFMFSTSQLPKVFRDHQFVNTFDFEMCFAPQPRALFRHLNFQKRSENEVFLAFWLPNLLHATTACNFLSLLLPNGSTSALASLLFDLPEPRNGRKTQCFATFLPFRAPSSSFYSLVLFWLLLLWLFLFSASSHLCCFICPDCRKFDF